jgi:hypothetical protein
MQVEVAKMRASEETALAAATLRLQQLLARPEPAVGPLRGLYWKDIRTAETRLAQLGSSERKLCVESIACELTVGGNRRLGLREQQQQVLLLRMAVTGEPPPESVAVDDVSCACDVAQCFGEWGDLVCPRCGSTACSIDINSESQSSEVQVYHYKHRRYAACVLDVICGSRRDPALPEWVVDSVMHHLVHIQQVRSTEEVTVGMIGLALEHVSIQQDEKIVKGRRYLKNRTDIWCKITGRPPPALVPRAMETIISLFAAVVQGPFVQYVDSIVRRNEDPRGGVGKHNFQAYLSFLRAAVMTELFRLHKLSDTHPDLPPLLLLGTLDVFMDQINPSSRNHDHDVAWTFCINQLHPELGLTLADLEWPAASRKRPPPP